ncbi:rho GTPase-activating protein 39-like [Oppia nitens]|uniref:rho GTPase-activating protein 39-like n=1 Tax=Oppia nitens TaxID=1686743 RepID=UPI0023DC3D49|nr:rho GTPase-activating protein 39-like [Oppia nitens]
MANKSSQRPPLPSPQSLSAVAGQWIEISEPKTGVQMFANLVTGECRWDEPRGPGVAIARASDPSVTQWWELYDQKSQRFYYYCARDQRTVWKRPTADEAVVVPLAKLQILKQKTTSLSPKPSSSGTTTTTTTTSERSTQTEPQTCTRSTQTSGQWSDCSGGGVGGHQMVAEFRNPSLRHYLISEARLTHAMRGVGGGGGGESGTILTGVYDSDDDYADEDVDVDESDVSCDADDEYDCDFSNDDDVSDDDEVSDDDRIDAVVVQRRRDVHNNAIQSPNTRQPVVVVQSVVQTTATTVATHRSPPLPSLPAHQQPTVQCQQQQQQHQPVIKSVSLSQISVPVSGHKTSATSPQPKRMTTLETTTTTTTAAAATTRIPPLPPPPLEVLSSGLSIESFAKENIERHRKLFIGKKVSLKQMLEWSKKSIRKPMISSISDHKLRSEAKLMFRSVQRFMHDIPASLDDSQQQVVIGGQHQQQLSSEAVDDDLLLQLLTTAAQQPILRDELLIQIARQTTRNPSEDSERRGLRLMAACFWYFPPSQKLAPHLRAFLANHTNPEARDSVRRKFEQQLRRSQQSHVVYVRRPHDRQEVRRVLRCVESGFVGVFGERLDDALIDRRLIPWPIVALTEALLRCRGSVDSTNTTAGGGGDESGDQSAGECCEREGVFRCVGDLDEVMRLKIKIDTVITSGDHPDDDIQSSVDLNHLLSDDIDIHVIASGLKLYFRELREPVVPYDHYWEALDAAHDPRRARRLVDRLAPVNRLSLAYLIRFLQVFSAPEHVVTTKMDDANLSMVWAPNLLRASPTAAADCTASASVTNSGQQQQQQDMSSIFERTRSEMSFVRTLIQHLDTSFVSGVR